MITGQQGVLESQSFVLRFKSEQFALLGVIIFFHKFDHGFGVFMKVFFQLLRKVVHFLFEALHLLFEHFVLFFFVILNHYVERIGALKELVR